MSDDLSSSRFLVTTLLFDLVILAVAYSGALPFDVSNLLVGFGLFVVSPVVAYVVARPRGRALD